MKKWDKATIQSPLAKAKGYGSAHTGAHHWIQERLTSLFLIPLMLWLVFSIVSLQGATYTQFVLWLAEPFNAIAMILSIVIGFYHAALGCQVIVEDYVHNEWCKIVKLIGIKIFFGVGAVVCIFSILKIAL